jgi:hypothetical protein
MANLEDAVETALPLVRALESRLQELAEHLGEAAHAIEEAEADVEQAWAGLEPPALALLQALPGYAATLRERAAASGQAVEDVPSVGASGSGGVALRESVRSAAAPAGTAVERFRLWLEAAVPPLRETDTLFRERAIATATGHAADLARGLEGGFGGLREALRQGFFPEMRQVRDGVGERIDGVRGALEARLSAAVESEENDWQLRLQQAQDAAEQAAFGPAVQRAGALLRDGSGARAQAAHAAIDALAVAAESAVAQLGALAAAVDAGAGEDVRHGQDLRAAAERATGSLRTAAGNLRDAQSFLAGLGFGDAC